MIVAASTTAFEEAWNEFDALREAYHLTVEAFADYLDHLGADGVLAVSAPTRLPPRLRPRSRRVKRRPREMERLCRRSR